MASILVLGLGNPILGDDGIGWRVAEQVQQELSKSTSTSPAEEVEVDCAALGGLSLMERMVGYDRVILVDAINTGEFAAGTVRCFPLEALPNRAAGHLASAHDATLHTALETGRSMGAPLPERVDIVAVETPYVYDFSDALSAEAAAALPKAVAEVMKLI